MKQSIKNDHMSMQQIFEKSITFKAKWIEKIIEQQWIARIAAMQVQRWLRVMLTCHKKAAT